MSDLYLKWTKRGRVPWHQGGDPIPYRKWTKRVPGPVPCKRGWHACRWEDAPLHIGAEELLWVCELDGQVVAAKDKVAAERLRLVRKVLVTDRQIRWFAVDAAELALPIFEARYPNDRRVRDCVEVTRRHLEGEATGAELRVARSAADAANADAADAGDTNAANAANAAYAAYAASLGLARAVATSVVRGQEVAARLLADRLLIDYLGLDPDDFAHREEM